MNSHPSSLLRPLASGLLLCALFAAAPLRAADGNPPDLMTYQGYLTDTSGNPLGNTNTGPKNYDVIFRIYNHQTGAGEIYRQWSELQTVTVDRGYFSVVLGEGGAYSSEARPPLSSVFTNTADASDRFIEMTVRGIGPGGADATLSPRLRLLPSPYAMLAATAVNARNLANSANGQVVSVSGTNVGINQSSPTASLDINGKVKATTLEIAGTTTFSGTVTGDTVTATTLNGTAVNGGTITASTGFVGPGTVPVGTIVMWSGASVPSGWALCNGQTVNGQQTPDLRGRFVLSSGTVPGLTARTVGQHGGEETHTLTVSEMPVHSHSVSDPGHSHAVHDPGHTHGVGADTTQGGWNTGAFHSSDRNLATTSTTSSGTGISLHNSGTGISLANTGGGAPHNNMPPYYVLAFIMRVQ